MKTFNIKVNTGSNKESVKKLKDDQYEISVKDPAKNGKANRRLREIVSNIAKVPFNSVKLVKGGKSFSKRFIIEN